MRIFDFKKRKFILRGIIFFLMLNLFLTICSVSEVYSANSEQINKIGRILYICSYSPDYVDIGDDISNLKDQISKIPAELDIEFLEANRFDKEDNSISFFRRLKYKIDNSSKYDAVIVMGDEAMAFVEQYRKQIFNDIPILFYGLNNDEKAKSVEKDPFIQGVHDEYSIFQNITIASGLNKNLKRVVFITDDTMNGFSVRLRIENLQEDFSNIRFNIIDSSNYTEKEIGSSVAKLKAEDSAVFYYGMHRAENGYMDDIEQIEYISSMSGAPVYTSEERLLGHGAIGGFVVSHEEVIKRLSNSVKTYLKSKNVKDININDMVSQYYYFDKKVLKKFGYDKSALPGDTVFVNEENLINEQFFPILTAALFLFFALFAGILRLIFMLKKNERITKELSRSRDSLLSSEQKMKSQYERLEYVVSHDSTTGLINRQEFVDRAAGELVLHESCAFLMTDIDDFKKINDTMGHHFGDEIIKLVADRIERMSAYNASVGRFGGDEFVIAIMDVTEEEVRDYTEKLRNALKQKFTINGKDSYLNFSTGIAMYPKDGNLITDLIVNADLALNAVKLTGKDSFAFFDEKMKEEASRKEEIETVLRRAINENGFELYYQPKIDLKYGRIAGFEALIRLKDKSMGPSVFIPVAEETGLIIQIDRWVTSEVIKRLSQWKIMGLSEIPVSVNYSAKQMRDRDYPRYVRRLLDNEDVEAGLLDIEITEGVFIDDNATSKQVVEELRQIGVTLSMDDFGTGYSSLNYLNYIDVDYVKLDKSMIDKYLEHEDEVISCTIALIHSLGLKVVAEGIDNWDDCDRIRECGCDYVQGNLLGKAMPVEDATKIHDSYISFEKRNKFN